MLHRTLHRTITRYTTPHYTTPHHTTPGHASPSPERDDSAAPRSHIWESTHPSAGPNGKKKTIQWRVATKIHERCAVCIARKENREQRAAGNRNRTSAIWNTKRRRGASSSILAQCMSTTWQEFKSSLQQTDGVHEPTRWAGWYLGVGGDSRAFTLSALVCRLHQWARCTVFE